MRFMLTIAIVWLLCLSGCAKKPAVYVDELSPIPLSKGQSFTAPQDGWFLTDPAMAELLKNAEVAGTNGERVH